MRSPVNPMIQLISAQNKAVMRVLGRSMITITECSQITGYSKEWLRELCKQDRIPGAYKSGSTWLIPSEWKRNQRKKGGWRKGKKRQAPFKRRYGTAREQAAKRKLDKPQTPQ